MSNVIERFIQWCMKYDYEISFFFIGYFFASFFEDLAQGHGGEAFFDLLIVCANIYLLKRDYYE